MDGKLNFRVWEVGRNPYAEAPGIIEVNLRRWLSRPPGQGSCAPTAWWEGLSVEPTERASRLSSVHGGDSGERVRDTGGPGMGMGGAEGRATWH